MPQRCVICQAA